MSYDHESHHGGRRPLPALELQTVLVGSVLILAGAIAYALGGGVGLTAAIGIGSLVAGCTTIAAYICWTRRSH